MGRTALSALFWLATINELKPTAARTQRWDADREEKLWPRIVA
jgi:hypothetical protein